MAEGIAVRMNIVLLLTGILMTGCERVPVEPLAAADCSAVPNWDPIKATVDARAAWHRNDRHLLGVYGFMIEVPGAEGSPLPVRMLEGTSDARCSELNKRAHAYANRYIREMTMLAAM